jgi:uncharacterized protein with beta-barrel porin domain
VTTARRTPSNCRHTNRSAASLGALRLLLASSSAAALLIGAGTAPALAACQVTQTGGTVASVSNSTAHNCIDVEGASVTGDVINTATGVLTANGAGAPSTTGITVNNSSIGGAVSNAGTIKANQGGILVEGGSTVSAGVINSGTISAGNLNVGIFVTGPGTFTGGISNVGSISGAVGIGVSNLAQFGSGSGANPGGITNSGTIAARFAGIEVIGIGTFAANVSNAGVISVSGANGAGIAVNFVTQFGSASNSVAGGITNTGTIAAGATGILIGNFNAGGAVIDTFYGGVINQQSIAASGGNGIWVGGASSSFTDTVAISTFSGGITNAGTGTISAGVNGIVVGGPARSSGSITIATFAGNISNGGVISTGGNGILIGGSASRGASVTVSLFSGSISNSGTISAGGAAIRIGGDDSFGETSVVVSAFTGGITNSGTITAGTGIFLGGNAGGNNALVAIASFGGGISNGGTIFAGGDGIRIGGQANVSATAVVIATFAGGITNSGLISSGGSAAIDIGGGAVVGISTFLGGITNSGTILGLGFNGIALNLNHVGSFNGDIVNASHASIAGIIAIGSQNGIAGGVSLFTGNVSNAGTLTSTHTAIHVVGVSTFAGNVVNSGSLVAQNTGVRIENVSSFIGGVTNSSLISATGGHGILVGGFAQFSTQSLTVGTFSGGISNGGTISAGGNGIVVGGFAQATQASVTVSAFAGGVTNSGTISAANAGILIGGGAAASAVGVTISTFAGGVINAGTITASGAGIEVGGTGAVTIGSFQNGITNAASATIAAHTGILLADVATFSGGVSNAGHITATTGIKVAASVSFAGGGAIVNSGTITGTTAAIDVTAATSAVTIDQTAGLITGTIRLSTNADVLNVTGGTISGNVVGAGAADTVNFALGSGTFTYASPFAMTGLNLVNFNSGTVFVDGSIAATTIDVNNGGTAAGTGTLSGAVTVMSGGTLMPGQPLGTLNVSGSVTFNAGSFYSVHVTPTTASATTIGGGPATTTINGGTVQVTLQQNGNYNQTYTIVTANGGRSGTFAALTFTGAFTFYGTDSLTYDADHVFLTLDGVTIQALLTSPGNLTVNEQNVLNGINNAIRTGALLPPGFENLFNLSGPQLASALDQLSGQNGAGFFQGAFQAGNSFLGLMVNPFVDGRFGNGFGPAIGFAPGEPPALPQAAAAFASAMPVKAPPATFDQRYGVWGAAYGGSGSVRGDPFVGSSTTTASVAAFAAGIDYRASPDTVFGFALAGGGTSWGLDGGLGGGRSDFFQAGLYGSRHWGNAYLSGALAYNFHDVTTNRTVTIAGTDMLQARFRANGVGSRLEGGYRVATPWLGITPYAAAQVQAIFLPNYGESATAGSNQFALNFASQTATTTRTELGAWFDKSWLDRTTLLGRDARMTLYGRLAWAHDFGNTPSASAIFQALPGSNFVVNGAAPARDGGLVTAGAKYELLNGWSFTAKFDGEFSSTTSIYSGTGMVRKVW